MSFPWHLPPRIAIYKQRKPYKKSNNKKPDQKNRHSNSVTVMQTQMILVLSASSSYSSLCVLHHHLPHYGQRNRTFFPFRANPNPARYVAVRCSSSVQEIQKPEERRELSSELRASMPFPPIRAAKRVVLVRHGQSTWNAEGRIQGSSNFSVLTKKGESQAETSRQMLIDDHFDACFARFLPETVTI